jgi:hypothetical protein
VLLHKSLKSGPRKQPGPTPKGYSKLRLPQLVGQRASVAAEGRTVPLEEFVWDLTSARDLVSGLPITSLLLATAATQRDAASMSKASKEFE